MSSISSLSSLSSFYNKKTNIPNRLKLLFKNINVNVNLPDLPKVNTHFILHNTAVLYFLLFLSLIYLISLTIQRNFTTASVFILTGFLTSFFSQNMIVVFLVSLIITIMHQYSELSFGEFQKMEGFKGVEGFEGFDEENGDEDELKDEERVVDRPEIEEEEEGEIEESEEKTEEEEGEGEGESIENLQQQTQDLLDTHRELMQNIETLKPYLKEATNFTNSLSKIMKGSRETEV